MFNLNQFFEDATLTLPALVPLVMALVTFWGKLGVAGKWQLLSSMASGLVLGGSVMYIQTPPDSAAGWFAIILFGLVVGLMASGCYEVLKVSTSKGSEDVLGMRPKGRG